MAAHKHVLVEDACSRCGGHGARDVEIFVGSRDFAELRVGDTISWSRSPQIQNGGRPSTGDSGLARGLSDCPGLSVLAPGVTTNLVVAALAAPQHTADALARMEAAGLRALSLAPGHVRFAVYRGIDTVAIDRSIAIVRAVMAALPAASAAV